MNDREALLEIQRIVQETIDELGELQRARGRSEPSTDELVAAAKTGVLSPGLEAEWPRPLVEAVRTLCEQLVGLSARPIAMKLLGERDDERDDDD